MPTRSLSPGAHLEFREAAAFCLILTEWSGMVAFSLPTGLDLFAELEAADWKLEIAG